MQLVSLILGTYGEMPGLRLTLPEAARMFGLRETTSRVVLNDLVRQHLLRCSADGHYASW
jgi:DNA-binding IclR family transcriptional regulator